MNEARSLTLGRIARRTFLVSAGAVGGGLLLGAGFVAYRVKTADAYQSPADPGDASFGAWLRVKQSGDVEVFCPHQDMGQGIYALAALIVGGVLKLPASKISVLQAPINGAFANPTMLLDGLPVMGEGALASATVWTFDKIIRAIGFQATGSSSSTRHMAEPLRMAALSLRDLLIRAAGKKWFTPSEQLKCDKGYVLGFDDQRAHFGQLTELAVTLPPAEIKAKPFTVEGVIGVGQPRFDVPAKARGQAVYGIDIRQKGQIYAVIRHAPRLGAKLKSARLEQNIPGVKGLAEGVDFVAVAAVTTGVALEALKALRIEWDFSGASTISSEGLKQRRLEALKQGAAYKPRFVHEAHSSPEKASGQAIKAVYHAPLLAHAAMEPLNATVLVTDTNVKIWAGTQSPQLAQMAVAKFLGIASETVEIFTPWLGGGFGRRADVDFVTKAVAIANKFKGTPVQTLWTREEDFRDDFFRPAASAEIEAKLDVGGLPSSFLYRVAVPSVTDQFLKRRFSFVKGDMMADRSCVDGAVESPYGWPNLRIESVGVDGGEPVGYWRSVGFSFTSFFIESFIDELAAAAGVNALEYRIRLLGASSQPQAARAREVMERMARYDRATPLSNAQGLTGRGFALVCAYKSVIGQAVDVEVLDKRIFVRRVRAIVDCGFAIDPPNVIAQIRSGVNFGLSAALYGRIELKNGEISQKNFDSYPIVSMAEAPEIAVDLIHSNSPLGGVGELGTPGLAPALANAIFNATGKRLRETPFVLI